LLTGAPLKFRISEIAEKEINYSSEENIAQFPPLVQAEKAGDCEFMAPLSIQLNVKKEYDHIRVKGAVDTLVQQTCSRCLTKHPVDIASSFTLIFTKSAPDYQDEEVELSEEDLVSVVYAGDEIDLSEQIVEQVLLELPLKPLCNEACKGLCSTCGTNLNNDMCGCSQEYASISFSALKNFKAKQ
jgi:uncharacterized protein